MIHTLAITKDLKLKKNLPLEKLYSDEISWFWVDFEVPDEKECKLLETHFHFHQLAIEDCLQNLQRPKLDFYDGYSFFVLHALNEKTLTPDEVDLFIGKNYIVSFHRDHLEALDEVWLKINTTESIWSEGSFFVCYHIIDKLVDYYFPAVYKLEDYINGIGDSLNKDAIDKVFDIRSDLLRLRRIINQMRDLLYRILNSSRLEEVKTKQIFFADIYDHLLRLSEMIETNQAITSEIRDSFLSLNSHRMNKIMMVLTVVTSVFIPLTFIAGVYGMNFDNMPELRWKYGYFIVMGIMVAIAFFMFLWFKRKGWFDVD
ncbi:MAG: magnesium/cobalt transporter CorA [Bacillota bacterium]|nr:magnesium/cobalt transporter CorA [Bacillota bacterium]